MFKALHENTRAQLVLGLVMGICFGFLLQKGQVTKYDIIMGQLMLRDFTVVKVMLSAVVTGMIGIYVLKGLGLVRLHPKSGSVGSLVMGGFVFGIGFGLLGYCPGTAFGAVGQGSLDALFGGVTGLLFGSGIFAAVYPRVSVSLLKEDDFTQITLPEFLQVDTWLVILSLSVSAVGIFFLLELVGL